MNSQISKVVPGSATIATPNVPVPLSPTPQGCIQITISALDTNKGSVYIGGKNVTTGNGIQLYSTATTTIPIQDISELWVVGSNAGDGVSFGYYI